MKTFNEFYKKNNSETLIEELVQSAKENDISPTDIIGSIIEEMMIRTDDPKTKEQLALYALELQEDFGTAIGNFAGRAVNAAGRVANGVVQGVANAGNAYAAARQPNQPVNQNKVTPPDMLLPTLQKMQMQYGKDPNLNSVFADMIKRINVIRTQQQQRQVSPTAPVTNAAPVATPQSIYSNPYT